MANYNDYIKDLVSSVGQHLAPQKRFDRVLSFDKYAAPQRAVFDEWQEGVFRPEVERFTLNPFQRQYENMAAASSANLMGRGQQLYSDQYDQLKQQSYFDPLEQAKTEYNKMLEQGYQSRMQRYYTSPTAFRNF
jgi:hypothetical protein